MTDLADSEVEVPQTVFIVDDDPAICESLCDLIESAGLPTRKFASAEEFLEICTPELSGCLVLDVRSARNERDGASEPAGEIGTGDSHHHHDRARGHTHGAQCDEGGSGGVPDQAVSG